MFRRKAHPTPLSATGLRLADVVQQVLVLDDGWLTSGPETPILGVIPQLDSMAAVALLTEIEERFSIRIADEDVSAQMLATFGDLLEFVESRLPDAPSGPASVA